MTTTSARMGLVLTLIVGWSLPATAQPGGRPPWPSAPWERGLVAEGLPISPFFEGWYENPDGTYTVSFGYFNRNREETVVIPAGPNNFLSPASYDGGQPTVFTPGRSTGVFTVTVPAEFGLNDGRVVWTLRTGDTPPHSVPGKVGVEAYRLHHAPMAMGLAPTSSAAPGRRTSTLGCDDAAGRRPRGLQLDGHTAAGKPCRPGAAHDDRRNTASSVGTRGGPTRSRRRAGSRPAGRDLGHASRTGPGHGGGGPDSTRRR